MRTIPLSQGKFALVNDRDYRWLSRWKWSAAKRRGIWYAVRTIWKPKRRTIYMHREILSLVAGQESDHKDGDGLHNWRRNLRRCTHSQNLCNQKINQDNTSGFTGVHFDKRSKRWMAHITVNQRFKFLGYFNTPIEAARARAIGARRYHGRFAHAV